MPALINFGILPVGRQGDGMNRIQLILIALLAIGLTQPGCAQADMQPVAQSQQPSLKTLFNKYQKLTEPEPTPPKSAPQAEVEKTDGDLPGVIFSGWDRPPLDLFNERWPQREVTYEMYFPKTGPAGLMVYGLAVHAGDITSTVSRDRLARGAPAFHYSVKQITDWANDAARGNCPALYPEEQAFLDRLVRDGVIIRVSGLYWADRRIKHVLGASPSKKRTLNQNLNHERIHVMWDEDPNFREKYLNLWRTLSEEEKRDILEKLKQYNPENEMQLIEEWAVYQNESRPSWSGQR